MPLAIRIHDNGGPEVLRLEQIDPGKPAAGEVQIRHTAVGVNYIDVYDRTGLYPVSLPSGLGREAAGVVVALGHTAATGQRLRDAASAGARLSTHLGNGCHAVLPRHDNPIWEQLADDRLWASLITDGHHLPPAASWKRRNSS